MFVRSIVACAAVVLISGVSRAQSSDPGDTWLMQNYRFTGPPPASELRPVDPVVAELREIQNTTLAILRKANFAGDFEAALAAAAQAAANAQLIGTITERRSAPQAGKTAIEERPSKPPLYLIALKDHSAQLATSYWADQRMLHYITLNGTHAQVRLDLVARRTKLEFREPITGSPAPPRSR